MNQDNFKIAAVVVTYNRLNLLKECINSIKNQTQKLDEIIIVNNSSTDGTLEWLVQQKDLTVINQKNSGSAGGQYTGIKTAYEKGYDWIWCMDDDCVAFENTLENLVNKINYLPKIGYLSSTVVSKNENSINIPQIDKRNNEFGINDWNHFLNLKCVKIREATFVSILFSRNAVKDHGFPKKELFIWGDDYEYTLRISLSYQGYLVGDSIMMHLREIDGNLDISKEVSTSRIKLYFFHYRNGLFLMKEYYSSLSLLKYLIFNVIKIGLLKSLMSKSKIFLKIDTIIRGIISGIYLR